MFLWESNAIGQRVPRIFRLVFILPLHRGAKSTRQVLSFIILKISSLNMRSIGQYCKAPIFFNLPLQLKSGSQLQRHGARFPTSGASAGILSALGKIQSVANYTDPRLNFLQSFTYNLGTNDLVPFGAAQYEPIYIAFAVYYIYHTF